ncbi:MAG: Gfo/Idh/MocA family oxidoreductase [Planctomycetes bacterium]|nr:Gfo/Idh/MocA family oxidoreductase [Planctomycetota bacterium]
MGRRGFLGRSAALGAGLVAWEGRSFLRGAPGPNESFVAGVMGLGRGLEIIGSALEIPGLRIAYVCDVDRDRVARAAAQVKEKQPTTGVGDFRRILDDRSVDLIFIATCNHWHAPATILACAAGKHVYVEKPGSHNPREGAMMVAAAKKHRRVVQMGNQRRSWPGMIEGIEKLRGGAIGTVRFARCWYTNQRPSIGRGKPAPVPETLDYSLWQGPAPERPYKDNLIHYNWHWHWHWGNGELGNNGVHALDVARWGLGVDAPLRVTYNGGRYHYDDDQETPDTGVAAYDFGGVGVTWDHSSCHPRKGETPGFVTFYGDGGMLALNGEGYRIHDIAGKEIGAGTGTAGERGHIEDLLACIRSGGRPRSDIEDAQKSTLLCHLGNISCRTGRTVHFDPAKGEIVRCEKARALWGREYRAGWEPEV